MKVIGGPLDGITYKPKSDDEYRCGYAVQMYLPNKLKRVEDFLNPDTITQSVTMEIFVYTVCVFKYNHGRGRDDISELWFLAPTDWSDWQAIQYQMRK